MKATTTASAIERAELMVLRAPVTDNIEMSFAPLQFRTSVVVVLRTADGLAGYGESWVNYPSWAFHERVATLEEGVFPSLAGADSSDIRGIHRALVQRLEPMGRQWGAVGPIMQAISAVDIALWDLAGRRGGRSTSQLLAPRVRDAVEVYASSLGPGDVAVQAVAAVDAGFTALKLKLGFGRERDVAALRAVREVSPKARLYADANQAWTLSEATDMAQPLHEYDVRWIEEPLRGNRLSELEELHRRTGLRIATGENIYGREQFERYACSPAIAVLQPDVCKAGGLTEALWVCNLASDVGKEVIPHFYGGAVGFAATLQLAAAANVVSGLEYDIRSNALRDRTLRHLPSPVNGVIDIPSGPGLGVEMDEAALTHLVVEV